MIVESANLWKGDDLACFGGQSLSGLRAVVRETQKIEGLRSAPPSFLVALFGDSSKIDEPDLVVVYVQLDISEPLLCSFRNRSASRLKVEGIARHVFGRGDDVLADGATSSLCMCDQVLPLFGFGAWSRDGVIAHSPVG